MLFPPHRRVLCQVPACRWHEGLKCAPADQLWAARLHVSMRRPRVIAVRVRPTSHNCISTRSQCGRICCASTNIAQLCVLHTFPPSPKKESRLQCPPTCQAPEKDYSQLDLTPRTFVAHVSPLVGGWLTRSDQTRRTGTDSWPSQEQPVSSDMCATQASRALCRQVQGK